jgi:hypothetical protein
MHDLKVNSSELNKEPTINDILGATLDTTEMLKDHIDNIVRPLTHFSQ